MFKCRIFQKSLIVDNFKAIKPNALKELTNLEAGKAVRELAEISAEVHFTPRGYRVAIDEISPVPIWNFESWSKICGISEDIPEGDIEEMNFDTLKAAQHFFTRRLKQLGWKPYDKWTDESYD